MILITSRKFAIGIAVLLIAGVVALVFFARNPIRGPAVSLSFIGFTNQSVQVGSNALGIPGMILVPKALLLARNTGSIAVEVWASIREENLATNGGPFFYKNGFWPVEQAGLPRELEPGESTLLLADPLEGIPWSTEVQYQTRDLADRFCVKLWNSSLAPLQELANRIGSSWWRLVPVKIGPFTNAPPLPESGTPPVDVNFTIDGTTQGPPPTKYFLDLIDTHYKISDEAKKP